MRKILLIATMLSVATSALAGFEVREMSLNGPGYGSNVTVVPMDTMIEASKHKLSYDFDEIELNHQYKAAKHVIDRMPLPQQAKIGLFWHNALIEQKLSPKTIPSGSVSLKTIVEKSPYDTSIIHNQEEYADFVRHAYTEKLNQTIPVQILEKRGNIFDFSVRNYSDKRITKLRGNLRIMDATTGRLLLDEMVTASGLWLDAKKDTKINVNMPSRVAGWRERTDNLTYKFTVTEVYFFGGEVFNSDEFYKKIRDSKIVLNPYPFTEI